MARCEYCNGKGIVIYGTEQVWGGTPCPKCGGNGVDDCCNGEVAQPETKEESDE